MINPLFVVWWLLLSVLLVTGILDVAEGWQMGWWRIGGAIVMGGFTIIRFIWVKDA